MLIWKMFISHLPAKKSIFLVPDIHQSVGKIGSNEMLLMFT